MKVVDVWLLVISYLKKTEKNDGHCFFVKCSMFPCSIAIWDVIIFSTVSEKVFCLIHVREADGEEEVPVISNDTGILSVKFSLIPFSAVQ